MAQGLQTLLGWPVTFCPESIGPEADRAREELGGGELLLMVTMPSFETPKGKYEWMNSSTFVGTLTLRPGVKGAVLIRVFQVV